MAAEGAENSEHVEEYLVDSARPEMLPIDADNRSHPVLAKENGLYGSLSNSDRDDQLLQMLELNFQNEYLKSQFEGLRNVSVDPSAPVQQYKATERDNEAYVDVKELQGKIESLNRELSEERQTRGAAEEALKHLRASYLEADVQAQELSGKLAEAKQKMDQEIKERDEKYSELDTKFNRLHKRAKQRIQDVQKEKDDVEAQLCKMSEKAESASSQVSALQLELERTRQQANEAVKAMDMERQQLRSANNKLRDNLEEMRRCLGPKENAIEALQQSLSEKEQMVEDMLQLLRAAEEKRQASLAEVSMKHQKKIESLEGQIADALADGSKSSETITSLRALVAEKESKIAEMEAASSGEVARLKAATETIRGELNHLKNEHDKEKESWESTVQSLKSKLEIAENNCIRSEIEVAKMRSHLESTLSAHTQQLNSKDADLQAAREEVNRIENEFASYKTRAHALLQRKDAELAAARDNEQVKSLEEALKEAEKEVLLVSSEREKALQDLRDTMANHAKELAARDEVFSDAQEKLKNMEMKLNAALSSHQSEKESWELNLQNIEETWRLRCKALEAQKQVSTDENFQKELADLKLRYKNLKEEHDSFRDLADKMIEEKDKEISRLLDDNNNLRLSLDSKPVDDNNENYNLASQKADGQTFGPSAAEQQILILARQQAQREEELAQSQRHILALQEELEELEHENRLHRQQEAMLKEEVRNMERMQKREGVDLTYLKNVVLKLLETGEVEALLPVIAMLLQFSPDEIQKCQQAYRSSQIPPSPSGDASGSTLSLFSRFSFS